MALKVRNLGVLLLLFPLQSTVCVANPTVAYDDAQILGECAGMLEFTSQILAAQGLDAGAEDFHQKANGWRIATIGALTEANWKPEHIVSTADSIYITALTQWFSKLERNDPDLTSELALATDECLKLNSKQEEYRRSIKLKQFAN